MTTFFSADTHSGHEAVIGTLRGPYENLNEMTQTLITNWNHVVQPSDWVFHLGDFGKWAGINLEGVQAAQWDRSFDRGQRCPPPRLFAFDGIR